MPRPISKTTTAPSSLAVSGSAAHMHSRDYIEIINVVYKDEFDGFCGRDHLSSDSGGIEPILRKTWMVQGKQKASRGRPREDITKKPTRVFSSDSNRDNQCFGNSSSFRRSPKKAPITLPHINGSQVHTSSSKLTPPTNPSAGRHDQLKAAPKDNFICDCKEGLIYLKKTYEWQNLLGDYRDEIFKLREVLKEKEQIDQKRARFKRSSTLEQRKNISELFKEYRSNSYQLLRLRMEERMRHEHKVFEKLSKKTQMLQMNRSDEDASHCSEKPCPFEEDKSSRSPTPPSSSEEDIHRSNQKNPKQFTVINRRQNAIQQPSAMVSSPKLYSKKWVHTVKLCEDENAHVKEAAVNRMGSGNRRQQRAVVRKRVVRCNCLNHS